MIMLKRLFVPLLIGAGVFIPDLRAAEVFSAKRVINQLDTLPQTARYRLEYPFELVYGPDDFLYVTERIGRVSRVNPATGARRVLLTIPDVALTLKRNPAGTVTQVGQDGLMGLALHPQFRQGVGQDFIFLAYVYDNDPGPVVDRRARIVRYWYSGGTAPSLRNPKVVLQGLPANSDHSSGRLVFGPDAKLYYTVGDLGGNQFENKCHGVRSQTTPTAAQIAAGDYADYSGKILRINQNGSVPANNPVFQGVRSHVYRIGHRNAQGLAFQTAPVDGYPAPVAGGKLYSSEHGPRVDDEINLIRAGRNYGWPRISGFAEDGSYTYYNYSSTGSACNPAWDDNIDPAGLGITGQPETGVLLPNFQPPLRSLYPDCASSAISVCDLTQSRSLYWPTIAPSSIDFYGGSTIPDWSNSLLVPTLKNGSLYRFKLNATNDGIVGDGIPYFVDVNRYRDVAISRTGDRLYLLTDTIGATSGPTGGGSSSALNDPGSILEFTYLGGL
ncbi:PQQ-dependent sugar dehydrogenase [Methylolobus aquaticus]